MTIGHDRLPEDLKLELLDLGLDPDTAPNHEQWQEVLRRIAPRFKAGQLSVRDLHHRVRTPMTVVLGASELLLETTLDAEQRQAVHSLYRSGRQVLDVLDNMLSDPSEPPKSWLPRLATPHAMPHVIVPKIRHRILLAEDNEFNRVLIERALVPLHCEVEYAGNGREVLEKFVPGKYALVLMDCEMPEMDGIQAAREIREREQGGAHVPILAVTAGAGFGTSRRCFEAGMDDFLAKPFSLASLRRKVMHWLFVGNQAAELSSSAKPKSQRSRRSQTLEVLDLSRLEELAREAGSPKIVLDLSHIFVEDLARRLEAIREALHARDERGFIALAHSIKGACSNFGAQRMASLGEELERKSKVGDFREAAANIEKLRQEFELVCRVLEEEVFEVPAAYAG